MSRAAQSAETKNSLAEIKSTLEEKLTKSLALTFSFLKTKQNGYNSSDVFKLAEELIPLDGHSIQHLAYQLKIEEQKLQLTEAPSNFGTLALEDQRLVQELIERLQQKTTSSQSSVDDDSVRCDPIIDEIESSGLLSNKETSHTSLTCQERSNQYELNQEQNNEENQENSEISTERENKLKKNDEPLPEETESLDANKAPHVEQITQQEQEVEIEDDKKQTDSIDATVAEVVKQIVRDVEETELKESNNGLTAENVKAPEENISEPLSVDDQSTSSPLPTTTPTATAKDQNNAEKYKMRNQRALLKRNHKEPLHPINEQNIYEDEGMSGPSTSTSHNRKHGAEVPNAEASTEEAEKRCSEETMKTHAVCACCSQGSSRWNCPNMPCANEKKPHCRIRQNDVYHQRIENEQDKNYCGSCFDNVCKSKRELYERRTLQSNDMEELHRCRSCSKWFHVVCSKFIGDDSTKLICFRCKSPSTPAPRQLRELMHVRMSEEMEKIVNHVVWNNGQTQKFRIYIRVLYCMPKIHRTKDHAPKTLERPFEDKYGAEFESVNRTICAFQEIDGVDVIFFKLFTQEYEKHGKKVGNHVGVVEYLDSVPFVQPREKRSLIHGTIINAYYSYLSQIGFSQGYLYAKAPVQGDDYCLPIHPSDQTYLSRDGLIEWYNRKFANGCENGLIGNVTASELKLTSKADSVLEAPFFPDGCWVVIMNWVEWDMAKKNLSESAKSREFSKYSKKYARLHKTDNIFISLNSSLPVNAPVDWSNEVMFSLPHMANREEFLHYCYANHLECRDIAHAIHMSQKLAALLLSAQDKRTEQMSLEEARHKVRAEEEQGSGEENEEEEREEENDSVDESDDDENAPSTSQPKAKRRKY